jgi:hypothetical protein
MHVVICLFVYFVSVCWFLGLGELELYELLL